MFSLFSSFLYFLPAEPKKSDTRDIQKISLKNTCQFQSSIPNSNLNFQIVKKNAFGRKVPPRVSGTFRPNVTEFEI